MKSIPHPIKMIIRGIIVFFLFFFSFLWQYIPLVLFHIDTSTLTNNYKVAVLFSTFSDVIVLLFLLLIYKKELIQEFKKFKEKIVNNISIGLIHWVIGITIMIAINAILYLLFKTESSNNEQLVRSFIQVLPIIMGINVCIVAPIVEEIVFRKTLKDIFKNKYIFAIASFLLFGGAHVVRSANTIVEYLYIIPYGVMGASFALADYKTDTIFTSIFLHIMHNTLTLLLIMLI